jgi:hypothetical protein
MSILGKVLIVLNLLAAAAFTYVTLDNWKVRKELTRAAFVRDIQLNGLPLEATTVADLDSDDAPFGREINKVPYQSAAKDTIDAAIPAGDEIFGGGKVYDQTAEVKRVKDQVFKHIPAAAADMTPRFQWLRAYCQAIARTGVERDGVNAIFDMRDPSRAYAAKRDLALAGRTESQVAALRALVEVSTLDAPDFATAPEAVRATRIAAVREAIKRFAIGETPVGAGGSGDSAEAERRLRNAIEAAFQPNAGEAERKALADAATDPAYKEHVAPAAIELLGDKPSVDRAAGHLLEYARKKAQAGVAAEAAALTAVGNLIRPPAQGFNLDKEIDDAGTSWLTARFEDATQPAAAGKAGAPGADPAGEKARKIAHLLYHIDGWRYADANAAAARKTWHTRVASVVGLPAYIRAAEGQATEYAEAGQRLTALITDEQSAFEAAYQAQIQRVLFLFSQWLAVDAQLKAQQVVTAENERLMTERKTERDNLLTELAQARADAAAALTRLTGKQKELFAIQKDLRNAQEALLVLEKELRKLELQDGSLAERK